MYIDIVPNRSSPPAVLLREDHREGGRTIKRTLANLSALPSEAVGALRAVLKGRGWWARRTTSLSSGPCPAGMYAP